MNNEINIEVESIPIGTKELFGASFCKIQQFAKLLQKEGEIRGIIGPRELPRLWSRHICNSLAVEKFLEKNTSVADLGSGAGFPGIVLAVKRPDLQLHIIEPMQRRCEWLKFVVQEIKIENVKIYQNQAHELHGKIKVHFVVSRAIAVLSKLLSWSMPLIYKNGELVAIKGEKAQDEIIKAKEEIKEIRLKNVKIELVETLGSDILANVVLIKK